MLSSRVWTLRRRIRRPPVSLRREAQRFGWIGRWIRGIKQVLRHHEAVAMALACGERVGQRSFREEREHERFRIWRSKRVALDRPCAYICQRNQRRLALRYEVHRVHHLSVLEHLRLSRFPPSPRPLLRPRRRRNYYGTATKTLRSLLQDMSLGVVLADVQRALDLGAKCPQCPVDPRHASAECISMSGVLLRHIRRRIQYLNVGPHVRPR